MSRAYVQAELLRRRTFDRVLLLVPGEEEIVQLADTALAIWECFQAPTSLDDAARRLASDYGEDLGGIQAEVSAAVEALVGRGALVAVS